MGGTARIVRDRTEPDRQATSFHSLTPSDYVLIEAPIEDEPARPAFAFSAWRHSLRRLARRGLRVLPVTEQVELGPDGEG
jgi:hypothetical protein